MTHRNFDPDAIRNQIANLRLDRDRIEVAISTLENVLHSLDESIEISSSLRSPSLPTSGVTLQAAVQSACLFMVDGITRQRIVTAVEKFNPGLHPKSASVAASLVNMAKGPDAILKIAVEGRGRSPAIYSTLGETKLQLSSEEISELVDENCTKGTGGWQSLWASLLKKFDKKTGTITLPPDLRAKIWQYYHSFGTGGWQNKVKKVFRRELPHLFQE